MPTQSESPEAVSGTSSKTLQLLRKRLRQLLRVMLVLTICFAVAATALAIWWLNSLNGLPDIGDPFDVAAFRTFSLPDDLNAFTFFRRAWKAIKPIYGGGWSETKPEFRAFVEANRPALELIFKGAEQVDGISGPVGEPLPGKIEYLDLMRFLDRRVVPPREQIEEEWTYRLGDMQLPIDLARDLYQVKRSLAREPERSRRVIRLLLANWLAHVEHPGQRKPAVRARFHIAKRTDAALLYHVSPDAAAEACALSPQDVARWLVTSNDAKLALRNVFMAWPAVHRVEQRCYRERLVLLAGEIYRRERGALPTSDEALVGTSLKSLPDDGSADLADEMTPTVE